MTVAAAQPADDVAARVLAAAARRFVANGVTKTTMAEIALEAGVSKPTLYSRYADKPAVVAALVFQESAAFATRVRAAAARQPTTALALEEAFVTAVRWLDKHPFLRKSLDVEPKLMLPILTEPKGPVLEAALAAFEAVVVEGIERGELRPVSAKLAAEVWWRLVLSYVLTPAAGGRKRDQAVLRELARETVLRGLVR